MMIPAVVKASEYVGPVGVDDDELIHDSLDAMRYAYEFEGKPMPKQVWGSSRRLVLIDVTNMLEHELEIEEEFVGDFPDKDATAELQAFIDAWLEKHHMFIYELDRTIIVLVDE